jgi:hypothetical protein
VRLDVLRLAGSGLTLLVGCIAAGQQGRHYKQSQIRSAHGHLFPRSAELSVGGLAFIFNCASSRVNYCAVDIGGHRNSNAPEVRVLDRINEWSESR